MKIVFHPFHLKRGFSELQVLYNMRKTGITSFQLSMHAGNSKETRCINGLFVSFYNVQLEFLDFFDERNVVKATLMPLLNVSPSRCENELSVLIPVIFHV